MHAISCFDSHKHVWISLRNSHFPRNFIIITYMHCEYTQGTVKQILSFSGEEGDPVNLNISGHFLVAGSNGGYVKVWDLTRR